MILNYSFYKICLLAFLIFFSTVNAEIIIHGTRVVYPSDSREITLQMTNNGTSPALVQAWIDAGDASTTPDQAKVPFIITPPITRVEAGKGQYLRIMSLPTASALSTKQETLFWLNILDIPPKPSTQSSSDNFLQLAVRSRIKLFYRPSSINDDVSLAPEKIQWSSQGSNLLIKNPTPFYITMSSIAQKDVGDNLNILSEGIMLEPFSEQKLALKNPNIKNIMFTTINDYGGNIENIVK